MSPPPPDRRLRVVIAGGGVCGALLATQLRRNEAWEVHCFEKSPRTGGPPGVSLLINHNAMATLEDYDPPLHARLAAVGSPVLEWAARSMTGEVLYAQDMVAGGLADSPGLVARWDHFVAAVREAAEQGEHGIRYSAQVDSYRYERERLVVAVVEGEGEAAARREVEADLLVAADGRFSHVRAQVEGGQLPPPRVMDVANFKFLCAAPEGLIDDYVRVYNTPAAAALQPHPQLQADADFAGECMRGLARVGLTNMTRVGVGVTRIRGMPASDVVGMYGNVRIPTGGTLPECAQLPEAMEALFTPPEGAAALDPLGKFIVETLVQKAREKALHWERFQEGTPRMVDEAGKVLLLGDAGHTFCPSLGLGASVAIEDACAAGLILREGVKQGMGVEAMAGQVARLRLPRAAEVARLSRLHAVHLAAKAGQEEALRAEVADWTGAAGGTQPRGEWRRSLEEMWKGWPRARDVAASIAAADAGQERGGWGSSVKS